MAPNMKSTNPSTARARRLNPQRRTGRRQGSRELRLHLLGRQILCVVVGWGCRGISRLYVTVLVKYFLLPLSTISIVISFIWSPLSTPPILGIHCWIVSHRMSWCVGSHNWGQQTRKFQPNLQNKRINLLTWWYWVKKMNQNIWSAWLTQLSNGC